MNILIKEVVVRYYDSREEINCDEHDENNNPFATFFQKKQLKRIYDSSRQESKIEER